MSNIFRLVKFPTQSSRCAVMVSQDALYKHAASADWSHRVIPRHDASCFCHAAQDALYKHAASADWIVWVDCDAWFNPLEARVRSRRVMMRHATPASDTSACVSVCLCVCASVCLCVCVFVCLCVSLSLTPPPRGVREVMSCHAASRQGSSSD